MVRSLAQRVRNKFQASVAEVGDNEAWQVATLGVAVVSNAHQHCAEMLDEIIRFSRDSRLDAEIVIEEREVLSFDDD